MTNNARGLSVAVIATAMLGATALSGPAFAQFRGGGGGGRGGGGGGDPGPTSQATDPGVRGGAPGAGGPLPGLSSLEMQFFTAAAVRFNNVDGVPAPGGLGPRFNLNSCGGCHAQPAEGGSSPLTNPQIAVATLMGAKNTIPSFITATGPVREVRFIKNPNGTPDGGVHDLWTIAGRTDAPTCPTLAQPNFAQAVAQNNAIFRIPTPTFGLGLVEATTDTSLQSAASGVAQQAGSLGVTTGTFNTSGNDGTITRFGWKAQNKSLLIFAGEAYNVEMGVTNEAFPNERDDTPGCAFNATPEDTTNFSDPTPSGTGSGFTSSDLSSDITNFAMFMRLLAPPTPATSTTTASSTQVAAATATSAVAAASSSTPTSTSTTTAATISQGQQVFSNVGCGVCHIPSQNTNAVGFNFDPTFNNVAFQPFSDFALHSMGTGLADNVSQGGASGTQFRSAPLWGIGQRTYFLHDGRTNNLVTAIEQHASSGSEANEVIENFNMLTTSQQQALINFLRSL
jgi:CxxC motif-containing protein (DUF1111 family)